MNRVLERRVRRLEQRVGSCPDKLIECELGEEVKEALREAYAAMGMAPDEIEALVHRRVVAPHPDVAALSPVEREQRLLAIEGMVAHNREARALLTQALDATRAGKHSLSPESDALLEEAAVMLERAHARKA